jgi:DNA-binding MltR family transcriptional regulator
MQIDPMPPSLRASHPHLEEFWPFIQTLRQESDRGRVLISAGFLEEQLKKILLGLMVQRPKSNELVEGSNAPLATFSARTEACYALGLITDDEYNDLSIIRRIRNEFAHNIETTFQTASVVSRCGQLRMKTDFDALHLSASGQFTTAATAVIMSLINRASYVSQERRQTKSWPS